MSLCKSDKLLRRISDLAEPEKGPDRYMFEIALIVFGIGVGQVFLTLTTLFNFAAGLVAFFFIVVCVLIFIFVYDNLRRQKKAPTPS
jgi:uncharacterized membrane protein